jgi:hypothetical protein
MVLQCVSNREEIKQYLRCAHPSRHLCGIAATFQTLLAYELPDPLNLRVEVTEDTGAKIHKQNLRARLAICSTAGFCLFLDIRSLTPAHLYELNQVGVSFSRPCRCMADCGECAAQSHLEDSVPFSRPAISELAPLSALRAEYENGSGSFIKQIDFLKSQGYEGIRRSRGDGDCFYRCLFLPPEYPHPSLRAFAGVDC